VSEAPSSAPVCGGPSSPLRSPRAQVDGRTDGKASSPQGPLLLKEEAGQEEGETSRGLIHFLPLAFPSIAGGYETLDTQPHRSTMGTPGSRVSPCLQEAVLGPPPAAPQFKRARAVLVFFGWLALNLRSSCLSFPSARCEPPARPRACFFFFL
jgi:hypothetical protein